MRFDKAGRSFWKRLIQPLMCTSATPTPAAAAPAVSSRNNGAAVIDQLLRLGEGATRCRPLLDSLLTKF
jgi:hypothetical protein